MVNHPFIGDLSDKTLEELSEKINDLNKKMQFMYKMGKHDMVRQVQMVVESYRAEYLKKQQELWDKKSNKELDKKIDIS